MQNCKVTRRDAVLGALAVPVAAAGLSIAMASSQAQAAPSGNSANLVAYLSRTGNTRVIAGQLQRATGADIFEIRAAEPYPDDYEQTVERARREREVGATPPLAETLASAGQYETVFLAFRSGARPLRR